VGSYDHYYQRQDYFGAPYPELLAHFAGLSGRGKVLDVGCGQGRNALPLARMGFDVWGIDLSQVGIDQMLAAAAAEQLAVTGEVTDIYAYDAWDQFDQLLFDSFFHFFTGDKAREVGLLERVIGTMKPGAELVLGIAATYRVKTTLNEVLARRGDIEQRLFQPFTYTFSHPDNPQPVHAPYLLVVWERK